MILTRRETEDGRDDQKRLVKDQISKGQCQALGSLLAVIATISISCDEGAAQPCHRPNGALAYGSYERGWKAGRLGM